jgi:hypothetical protein
LLEALTHLLDHRLEKAAERPRTHSGLVRLDRGRIYDAILGMYTVLGITVAIPGMYTVLGITVAITVAMYTVVFGLGMYTVVLVSIYTVVVFGLGIRLQGLLDVVVEIHVVLTLGGTLPAYTTSTYLTSTIHTRHHHHDISIFTHLIAHISHSSHRSQHLLSLISSLTSLTPPSTHVSMPAGC